MCVQIFSSANYPLGSLFIQIKSELDRYIEEYTTDNPPPVEQLFTVPNKPGQSNFHIVQKFFTGPFEFDVLFSSASAPEPMTSESIDKNIEKTALSFTKRFDEVLAPQAPFGSAEYSRFSKAMLSNLVGGIGYFHGQDIVDRTAHPAYDEENEGFWEETEEARTAGASKPDLEGPKDLFTCVPSRPFFPRGFLWDEGFHLMPVIEYDPDVAYVLHKPRFITGVLTRSQT